VGQRIADGFAYGAQKLGLAEPNPETISRVEKNFQGPAYTPGYVAPIGAEIHSAPLGTTAPTAAPVHGVLNPTLNAAEPHIEKIKPGDELGATGNIETTKGSYTGA